MFIDSHCHLSFPELSERLPDVLAAMRAAQVDQALCICTTLEESSQVLLLAHRHEPLWASVGVHPDNEGVQEPSVEDLLRLAEQPKVVAIGETGLDYYRLNGRSVADMAWQRDRFRVHIQAAKTCNKPLVIHTRSSADDTLGILREEGAEAAGGVFHCFTEELSVARAAVDMGFYISFSGILTFRNAVDLCEVARRLPRDRVLIETDSPYLAPVPYRGKVNQPGYVPHVASKLADLWGISLEKVAEITTANTRRLFRLPTPVTPC
ncbi:TatD family hydrolase [Inhella gelatinilytica]|uniref:TatD family hydrolase n=1 Tax=Inhella gelatinilytica TaxID=2795030 RepID=A0A931IYQ8_9BURK|nr:TatD family hydrolase [Inhella gelatinilytica]MBH9553048.1 TatD family hydrolase [Inhella gelatinilytica]